MCRIMELRIPQQRPAGCGALLLPRIRHGMNNDGRMFMFFRKKEPKPGKGSGKSREHTEKKDRSC